MRISVTFEQREEPWPSHEGGRGPVQVGWCLTDPKGGIIYAPPERVRSADLNRRHAKSASRCPAVNLSGRGTFLGSGALRDRGLRLAL